MKNKILIIGQLPPPYHGSNVMAKIMLSVLRKQGYDIIFINKSFAKSIDTIGKPSLRKILRIPILAVKTLFTCLLKRPSMCIYFVAVGKSAFLVDAFLIYLIHFCHLPYILRFGGKGYRELQNENFFYNFLVSITLSNALGGIVLGQTIKRDVNNFIPDDRLVFVPNGTANHPLIPIKKNDRYVQILYLSNLVPTKGSFEVLMAAKIIIQKQHNVRFVFAGADSAKFFTQKLRSYIVDNGLDEYVSMVGQVYGKKKEELFSTSDIFVFPTYFKREIFGNVNVEAMSWGLPVISSNEGVISEIVKDGITGFIVDPKSPDEIADKIVYLVNNPELRYKMGMNGRKKFESKYSLEAHAKFLNDAIRYFLDFKKN